MGRVSAAFSRMVLAIGVLAGVGPAVAQELVVPKRHAVYSSATDFPGSDLTPIFETSLDLCQQSCLTDRSCRAFTYNLNAGACFPKARASEAVPFVGALSARILNASPALMARAAKRQNELAFVDKGYLQEAATLGRTIGMSYPADGKSVGEWLSLAVAAVNGNRQQDALRGFASAAAQSNKPEHWLRLAVQAQNMLKIRAFRGKSDIQKIATGAAIGAYARAARPVDRIRSLMVLANGLETRGHGRLSIPVLELAAAIDDTAAVRQALDRADRLFGLGIENHTVDTASADPRICVTFNDDLMRSGVEYSDYVKLEASTPTVTVSGRQLCIDGAENGQRYAVTFRRGLPAASGLRLRNPVTLDVFVRDRDPMVRFGGRAYVLPRTADAAIPLTSVNVETVNLKVYRIDERNLVRAIRGSVFGQALQSWDEENLQSRLGEVVWTGTADLRLDLNAEVTTRLPMAQAVTDLKPGVYALTARTPNEDVYDNAAATQWFVISDLGVATLAGDDGLHGFVRSLTSADPVAGATLRLVSVNNTVLGTATTDDQGYAVFAPGLLRGKAGNAPAMLTVEKGDDFAFLNMGGAAFDLSDRGVTGNPQPGPVDVFMSTDRGAYRAGEVVHAVAIARDDRVEAITDLPMTAIASRPDGVEFSRIALPDQGAGGRVLDLALPANAQRGTWTVKLYTDVDAPALAQAKFLVEDFVPERIDFDLTMPGEPLDLASDIAIGVDAKYLYGAPGAHLPIEGQVVLSASSTLPDFPGYTFGNYDERFAPRVESLQDGYLTDDTGHADVFAPRFELPETTRPLLVKAVLRMSEGSNRPVERRAQAQALPGVSLIGIRKQFDGDLPEGATAAFDLIGLDPTGARAAMEVKWTLNRVRTRYQWYRAYGRWNWEPITTRERVASGRATLSDLDPAAVSAGVNWGRYELRVERADSGPYAAAAVDFYAGWYVPADTSSTPDTLDVRLDQPSYRIGDTARLRVVPRYAGKALITVMANRLVAMKTVDVVEGENLIDLPVTDDWGAGVYVAATVIRPMSLADARNPARALGLGWAGVDPGVHALSATFTNAEESAPRGLLQATLKVEGVQPGDTAYATIAAVDVGILNLTGFTAPDPQGHYFDQRRLGMEIRDIYGQLIDGLQGDMGALRQGGDALAQARLQSPPPTEKLVAMFQGPVTVGADGLVHASFDIPDFNGTVRLMAVVWSDTGIGQAQQDVLVRDPVVVTANLPRFMAPSDSAELGIELAHATGPDGPVKVAVSAPPDILIDDSSLKSAIQLSDGGRVTLTLPMTARRTGVSDIDITVTTPGGQRLVKTVQIGVLANDPEIARTVQSRLRPGKSFTLDDNAFAGLRIGTARATMSAGPIANLDAPGLLQALDRYPYGCTEQLTSRALPLIYFDGVATTMGLDHKGDIRKRVNGAIRDVLLNQSASGAFGLWRPGSGDMWLDAYVTDFLSRARAQGYEVPDQAFARALENLRNRVNYYPEFELGGQELAYALMVLAREGRAAIGDLRYYADARASAFSTPLAKAQLGAALAYYGDQTRADQMFRAAGRDLQKDHAVKERHFWRLDYGTNLRDTAAVLALAVEAGSNAVDVNRLSAWLVPDPNHPRRSTQEATWSLLAANALIKSAGNGSFTLNGQSVDGPLVQVLDGQTSGGRSMVLRNESDRAQVVSVTAYGVPTDPEPAGGNGYAISRRYFSLDGQQVDPSSVALNARMVVVLDVKPTGRSEARLMVNDPLPAGFEIDNPHLLESGDLDQVEWLGETANARHSEFRTDRFLAAVDWRSDKGFRLAYVVRAVSAGRFHHPAASVEDMYRPQMRARTDTAEVVVHR